MSRRAVAISAVLSLFPPSQGICAGPKPEAKNWVKIRSLPESSEYIDKKSIRIEGQDRYIWEKTVDNLADPNEATVDVTLWRIDCLRRRDMMLYNESYLKDGTLFSRGDSPAGTRMWAKIMPDSVAETMLKIACSR